jgi:hypothetical protein
MHELEVQWLYAHFQAISRASNLYLYGLGLVIAISYLAFDSDSAPIAFQYLDRKISPDLLLSVSSFCGAFLLLAFFGAYDKGEHALHRLCAKLKCKYEELDYVDLHPNVFDHARHARDVKSRRRSLISRLSVSLLSSVTAIAVWGWLVFVVIHSLSYQKTPIAPTIFFLLTIFALWAAAVKGVDYVSRRWRTFLADERARRVDCVP